MIHHYGTLSIDVDPRTGRGRVVLPRGDEKRGKRIPKQREPANGVELEGVKSHWRGNQTGSEYLEMPGKAPGKAQDAISTRYPHDSKLELRYEQYLMCLKFSGEITSYTYHPFTISLAEKRKYTPDFLLVHKHGHMTLVELKGSLKMKNARDSLTRMHVAAGRLPGFTWKLVQRVKGQWVEEVIHGA